MPLSSDLEFAVAKLREARRRRITPVLAPDHSVFGALRRDGIVVIPHYAAQDMVQQITDELRSNTDLLSDGNHPDIVKRNARSLLLNPRQHVPRSAQMFDDDWIRNLARAYLSPSAVPDREAIQIKNGIGETSIVDLYHIDEWRPLLSVFVYLDDIEADNAPMEYLVGSHRWRPWRVRREQDFFRFYRKDAKGSTRTRRVPTLAACFLPRREDCENATAGPRFPVQALRTPNKVTCWPAGASR